MKIRLLRPGDAGDKALMDAFFDQMGFEARSFFNHGDGNLLITHQANIRAQMLYAACGFVRQGTHSSGEVLYCWSVSLPV